MSRTTVSVMSRRPWFDCASGFLFAMPAFLLTHACAITPFAFELAPVIVRLSQAVDLMRWLFSVGGACALGWQIWRQFWSISVRSTSVVLAPLEFGYLGFAMGRVLC